MVNKLMHSYVQFKRKIKRTLERERKKQENGDLIKAHNKKRETDVKEKHLMNDRLMRMHFRKW